MLILIFTDFDLFLCVGKNLLKFILVVRLAIGIVIGIKFFIVQTTDGCAARDSAGIEADDVVAIEDCGVKDVFGGVGVINARSAGAAGVNYEAAKFFTCSGFIFEECNFKGAGGELFVVDRNGQGGALKILVTALPVDFLCVVAR